MDKVAITSSVKAAKKFVEKIIAEEGCSRDDDAVKIVWTSPDLLLKTFVDAITTVAMRRALKEVFAEVSIPPNTKGSNRDRGHKEKEEAIYKSVGEFIAVGKRNSKLRRKIRRRGHQSHRSSTGTSFGDTWSS